MTYERNQVLFKDLKQDQGLQDCTNLAIRPVAIGATRQ